MTSINLFSQDFSYYGHNLNRPECVLTTAKGDVYVSDFRGGVTQICANGEQHFFNGTSNEFSDDVLKTNGFAIRSDGDFLIAHLGDEQGGVYRLDRNQQVTPFLVSVDGVELPPTNFVHIDHQGRIWITVSTRIRPRANAYRPDCSDGFIVLVENGKASIVADGLGYTNECWVTPDGKWLYANATFSRELLRWEISPTGDLRNQRVITKFSAGTFPDGLVGDETGGLWVTSIVSNQVIKVQLDGSQTVYLQQSDPTHVANAEQAFQSGTMGRAHLDNNPAPLKNLSSMAFGGSNRDTLFFGCLLDDRIVKIADSGIKGIAPSHWLL